MATQRAPHRACSPPGSWRWPVWPPPGCLSNREIAERLYLSVRTVETQLQRVYEKLGVHRRDQLPIALES